jgi:nucleoside-diphosphate-sugar epimerase
MEASGRGVRRRQTAPRTGLTVGVTGAAGPLGYGLASRLLDEPTVGQVVGLDTSAADLPSVVWRTVDVRDPTLASQLGDLDVLVHLATDRSTVTPAADRWAVNVRGTETVVAAAAAAGVRRLVLVTSAMVYGAAAGNAVPLDEDAALLPGSPDGLVGEWLAMERAAADGVARDGLAVTVIRPASLVGVVADALLPGLFESVRLLEIRDGRCHWQFCHTDDLLAALVAAVRGDVAGVVTVGCEGWLEQADVAAIAGMRSLGVRRAVAAAAAGRLHRLGVLGSPASELHYLTHPWVVGSQRLRASGWRPEWTNEQALREHLRLLGDRAGRSLLVVDRSGATRAAAAGAGATVAVVGSVLLARSRARQR